MFKSAIIQMDSRDNITDNLKTAVGLIGEAVSNKTDFILLPENFLYIGSDKTVTFSCDSGEIKTVSSIAKESKAYILAGSIPETTGVSGKNYNTSILINPEGDIIAKYRKIHLFDVGISQSLEYRESDYVIAGDTPVVVDTELGKIGLSICYDLRFPELYRVLARMGAEVIALPSNFTAYTGKSHWKPLIQARAIENGVYVLAPNQTGVKYDSNTSHGNSMAVCPWGNIISNASTKTNEIIYADIDINLVKSARNKIPAISNMRIFSIK